MRNLKSYAGPFTYGLRTLVFTEIAMLRGGIGRLLDIFYKIFALTFAEDQASAIKHLCSWQEQEESLKKRGEFDQQLNTELIKDASVLNIMEALTKSNLNSWFEGGIKGSASSDVSYLSDYYSNIVHNIKYLWEMIEKYINKPRIFNFVGDGPESIAKRKQWQSLWDCLQNSNLSNFEKDNVWRLWLLSSFKESCKRLAFAGMEEGILIREKFLSSNVITNFSLASAEEKFRWILYDLGAYTGISSYIGEFAESIGWNERFVDFLNYTLFLRGKTVENCNEVRTELLNLLFIGGAEAFLQKIRDILLEFEGALNPLAYRILGISEKQKQMARDSKALRDAKVALEGQKIRWSKLFDSGVNSWSRLAIAMTEVNADNNLVGPFLPIEVLVEYRGIGKCLHTLKKAKDDGKIIQNVKWERRAKSSGTVTSLGNLAEAILFGRWDQNKDEKIISIKSRCSKKELTQLAERAKKLAAQVVRVENKEKLKKEQPEHALEIEKLFRLKYT